MAQSREEASLPTLPPAPAQGTPQDAQSHLLSELSRQSWPHLFWDHGVAYPCLVFLTGPKGHPSQGVSEAACPGPLLGGGRTSNSRSTGVVCCM